MQSVRCHNDSSVAMLLQCVGKGLPEEEEGGPGEARPTVWARPTGCGPGPWRPRDASSPVTRMRHLVKTTYGTIDENSNLE